MTASATRLISAVQARGGQVRLDGETLLVEAAKPLPAELIEQLRNHKPEIVRVLLYFSERIELFDRDTCQERAAIIEANGIPREWAESYAAFCTMSRPDIYRPERWQQIVNDGGCFLDQWSRRAAALGWRAVDCFGVDPNAPENRYDGMVLVPLLNGQEICAVTTDTARINCGNNIYLTFYRNLVANNAIAFWEIEKI